MYESKWIHSTNRVELRRFRDNYGCKFCKRGSFADVFLTFRKRTTGVSRNDAKAFSERIIQVQVFHGRTDVGCATVFQKKKKKKKKEEAVASPMWSSMTRDDGSQRKSDLESRSDRQKPSFDGRHFVLVRLIICRIYRVFNPLITRRWKYIILWTALFITDKSKLI